MCKVALYIETLGTSKYLQFITQSFDFELLNSLDPKYEIHFDGWKKKNMGNWIKYQNEDGIVIEIYDDYFFLKKDNTSNKLPIPLTINDFINLMNYFNVNLYWCQTIDIKFEPKDYLRKEDIENYYVELLKQMDKSHELI